MAPEKFLAIISKFFGKAGEESDALSAYTQVKMTDAPRTLRSQKADGPRVWSTSITKNWDDPLVSLERN